MKKIFFVLFIFILSIVTLKAQNIVVQRDSLIDKLIENHKQANIKIGVISGYRVQIFFDSGNNSRQNAEAIKNNFTLKYPDVPVYLTFKEPNFRVRIGDFRTLIEARGFLNRIQIEYPNAFVIKDKIKFPILQNKKINTENE